MSDQSNQNESQQSLPPSQQQPQQSLSEISHLFLSNVRQNTNRSMPRPVRTPPGQVRPATSDDAALRRTDLTVDLTPEEFAHVFGDPNLSSHAAETAPPAAEPDHAHDHGAAAPPATPVRAVIAAHIGASQLSRVREFAAALCRQDHRVGLIVVDASEFRLSVFDHEPHSDAVPLHPTSEPFDPRRMAQAMDELAWDVDEWLVLLPSPRGPEARSILRDVEDWTLLTTCDHDGVVSCYRTLKGLADLSRPRLTLAPLGVRPDSAEAQNAFARLSSVCTQFLEWSVALESVSTTNGISRQVGEHVIFWSTIAHDKAQLATAPQWRAVAEFLARATTPLPMIESFEAELEAQTHHVEADPMTQQSSRPAATIAPEFPRGAAPQTESVGQTEPESNVIDLADVTASPAGIVSAVLRGKQEFVECPVKPPMCPDASLAVTRERRLVLIAVARQGLPDLNLIGRAYQWLIENRALITMAVPQMSIDAHQLPVLHLLVDHADVSADLMQPILHSSHVKVHAYRKLRWGARAGLLLEAA